jgi:hypothetical protein
VKLPRQNFLHLAAGAAALPFSPQVARAQAYPTRPVRLIVPLSPAGASDITARLMGSSENLFPKGSLRVASATERVTELPF